jgi:iron complex outermembrane recepter protein
MKKATSSLISKLLMASISATALVWSGTAFAQDSKPPEAEADDGNAIVVTARRIEERLQDVPIAVSAITSQDMERQRLEDLGDIAEKTVGFAFESFTGPLAQPVIRGQTNLRVTSPVQNVATNLNGIYIQRGYFVDQGLLDLERVEIIKGPQSALYGRNAFAGAISLIARSANVDADLGGRVSGTIGNYSHYEIKGGINVPIIPGHFAIFAAGGYAKFDGTWPNNHPLANAAGGFTTGRLGGYRKDTYQLGAQIKLGGVLTLDGMYIHTNRQLESNPAYTLTTAGLTTPFNSLNASPTGTGAARQNRLWVGELLPTTVNAAGETRLPGLVVDPRSYGLRGPSEIYMGKMTLDTGGPVSIQYLYGHTAANIDARGSAARDALNPTVAFGTNFGVIFDSSGTGSRFKSDSHEGRADFKFGSVSGFVGVNFTKTSDDESNASEFAPVNSLEAPNPLSLFPLGPGNPIPTTVTFRRNTYLRRVENVFSAFGFLNWKVNDAISVTLEGRYTTEDQKLRDLLAAQPGNAAILALVPPLFQRTNSFFTPRAAVTYKISPDHTVYLSAARGVKSGGLNGNVPFVPQQTYEAETNWTYEIGSKNMFLDGKLQLNLAAFYTQWKNLQTNSVRLLATGLPASFVGIVPSLIGNAGDVNIYGVEIEGNLKLTRQFKINFGAAYNHARYASSVVSQRFGASGNCDGIVCTTVPGPLFPVLPIGGNQLERTPAFDALVGLNFDTEFSNGWKFFARADLTYQTKQFADEANLAYIPDRTLVNASLGLGVGGVDVQLWVKNVFDKKYVTSALFLIGTGGAGSASYVPLLGEQRTMGATASFKF